VSFFVFLFGSTSALAEPVSGFSEGQRQSRWMVRGNRLLIVAGEDDYANLRFQAFNNGLELWDQENNRHLRVRQ